MLKVPPVVSLALVMMAGCVGDVIPPADENTYGGASTGSAPDVGSGAAPTGDSAPNAGSAAGGDPAPDTPSNIGGSFASGSASSGSPSNTAGSPSNAASGEGPAVMAPSCAPGGEPLASGVRIRDVAFYQTVKVPVIEDARWVSSREVPLVQGKESLVRLFVDSLTGAPSGRPLRATLALYNDGAPTLFESEMAAPATSSDERLESTFNFEIPGAVLREQTELSVTIQETTCTGEGGAAADARFPTSATQPLNAVAVRKLRVVLVPITASGLTPSTSLQQVEAIRAAMAAYYPVPEVEVTTHAPLIWNQTITGTLGWNALLDEIGALRQRDSVDRDVYYYGLVTPEATFASFCRRGCTLGIAPQTLFVSPAHQIGLGVGYEGSELTYGTIVHELGHAHGLGHAPCAQGGSISGVDRSFPYADGATGAWGWDARTGKLKSPQSKDIMGYCEPTWIGNYNYVKLVERSLDVNTAARLLLTDKQASRPWRSIILDDAHGTAQWGRMSPTEWPGGAEELATVLDHAGAPLSEVLVSRVPLAEADGAFLYIPPPQADWAGMQLDDRTLMFSDID